MIIVKFYFRMVIAEVIDEETERMAAEKTVQVVRTEMTVVEKETKDDVMTVVIEETIIESDVKTVVNVGTMVERIEEIPNLHGRNSSEIGEIRKKCYQNRIEIILPQLKSKSQVYVNV